MERRPSDRRIQQSRRGFRELPGASVRVRGQNDLPYNPGRPLRLPSDRQRRRAPQFNFGAILRLLLPVMLLAGLGVGVFFGVDALLDDGDPSSPAAGESLAGTTADSQTAVGDTGTDTASGTPASGDPAATTDTAQTGTGSEATATADPEDASAETTVVQSTAPRIITPADLDGAPVVQERGAARPIPAGIPDRTLADGSPYDPTDAEAAFSSVWAPGTVVEVTRLPGAPLLSDEEAAQFVGKTIRLTIVATGTFPEELQLTPAAYGLLAKDLEPIIAVRIEAVGAPE